MCVYGLKAEHTQNSSLQSTAVFTKLTNDIYTRGKKLPNQFKIGVTVPYHKKKKVVKNPDNYRRITIASHLGKIVERQMITCTPMASRAKHDPSNTDLHHLYVLYW